MPLERHHMNLLAQATQPRLPLYCTIELTLGQFTIVSAHRYEWATQWSWHAGWNPHTNSYYAKRSEYMGTVDGKRIIKTFRLHREILGLKTGDPQGDHHNGDTLDNTDDNLRVASHAQNMQNRGKSVANTSGFKGVSWHKRIKKWAAYICVNGKLKHLGYYDTREEAYAVHCAAALKYHGEFARLA